MRDARPEPEAVSSVRMAAVEITDDRIEAQRERRVPPRLDLAQHQAPLLRDFVGRQRRLEHDLGDEPEQGLPVIRQGLAPDLRGLDLPRRVQRAADLLGRLGELDRRPPGGAARHAPDQKIRDAGGLDRLESRTSPHLERCRDHGGDRMLADENRHAAREHVSRHGGRSRLGRRRRQQAGRENRRAHRQAACHGRSGISASRV